MFIDVIQKDLFRIVINKRVVSDSNILWKLDNSEVLVHCRDRVHLSGFERKVEHISVFGQTLRICCLEVKFIRFILQFSINYFWDENKSSLNAKSNANLSDGLVVFLSHSKEFFVLEDGFCVLVPDSCNWLGWVSEWRVRHDL